MQGILGVRKLLRLYQYHNRVTSMAIRLCKHLAKSGILLYESGYIFFTEDLHGKRRDTNVPSYFFILYLIHLLLNPECAEEVNFKTWLEQALYSALYKI